MINDEKSFHILTHIPKQTKTQKKRQIKAKIDKTRFEVNGFLFILTSFFISTCSIFFEFRKDFTLKAEKR